GQVAHRLLCRGRGLVANVDLETIRAWTQAGRVPAECVSRAVVLDDRPSTGQIAHPEPVFRRAGAGRRAGQDHCGAVDLWRCLVRGQARGRAGWGRKRERDIRHSFICRRRAVVAHVDLQPICALQLARRVPAEIAGWAVVLDDLPDAVLPDPEAIVRSGTT